MPERVCMPKTAYVQNCPICLDFPTALDSDVCYSVANNEKTMAWKDVPPEHRCTPANAKSLNCIRCLRNVESNLCLSYVRRYRRDLFPTEDQKPVLSRSDSDNTDSDVTIASTSSSPPKLKQMSPKAKVSAKIAPNKVLATEELSAKKASNKGLATEEANTKRDNSIQGLLSQFDPSEFLQNVETDDHKIAAAGLAAAGMLLTSAGILMLKKTSK
ncbi:hypothetical protein BGZ76_007608 [Entomortierella beljakovae]|nr:hypothetical protein BGZ76_007608 [Entomortierella beljakovae]